MILIFLFRFFRACNLDTDKVVQYLKESLAQSSSGDKKDVKTTEIIRALLAIEELLRTDLIHPDAYDDQLNKDLTILMSSAKNYSPEIMIKCKKILLIIQGLKKYSEE